MKNDQILGTSKISSNMKVTMISRAAKILNVGVGDHIVYVQNENGEIIIKKS